MTRSRKVQWADDSDEENQQQRANATSSSENSKKSMKSGGKKLVQVRSYSGYADSMKIEKIVQTSPTQRKKTQKFDRNLSTVQEEADDVSESDASV